MKHVEVGQQIKKGLEKILGSSVLIAGNPCTYDYYICIRDTTLNKCENLEVNLTDSGKIQLRLEKENGNFRCFTVPFDLEDADKTSDTLLKDYLKYKKRKIKRLKSELEFHSKFLS